MKTTKIWKSVIWPIILESIWIVDLGIELYTGETTGTELITQIAFCAILAVIIYAILRRKYRNK